MDWGIGGYWLIFLISLGESLAVVGTVVPGTLLVMSAGFLSSQGYLNIGNLFWFVAIGAILGDGVSYYLGTKGKLLFNKNNRVLKLSHLELGKKFFHKHGTKSIFLARFIGPLRPIVPFVAGISGMNKRKFLFWNVTSALLWSAALLGIGYFFGSTFL